MDGLGLLNVLSWSAQPIFMSDGNRRLTLMGLLTTGEVPGDGEVSAASVDRSGPSRSSLPVCDATNVVRSSTSDGKAYSPCLYCPIYSAWLLNNW